MHLQDINALLNLQEVMVKKAPEFIGTIWVITVEPLAYTQPCPCCHSHHVIRKGSRGYRRVRHLPVFGHTTQLQLPKIQMQCKDCHAYFSWTYSFVEGKSRFTHQFKEKISMDSLGSTVTHTARTHAVSYSSCERMFKQHLDILVPQLDKKAICVSRDTNTLVIGIDDFAIRKGHTYNTGIHDIRNGSLLHVISGRKLEELRKDVQTHPDLYTLQPVAVVMDLAKYYHTFAAEVFPKAVRIADHFHVNRYILDCLQQVRRRISKEQPRHYRLLKGKKSLLSRRLDSLSAQDVLLVEQLLVLSPDLRAIYDLKEELITWYECSSNVEQATYVYKKWLEKAKRLAIPELHQALITFENWQEEIINYHRHQFTNAAVEGKNNKIKALQRRCYFTRNRHYYLMRIKAECNSHIMEL
jgi:transposase